MSRDQQPDRLRGLPDPADEPTTGPPAGAVSASGPGAAPGPGSRETTSRPATTGGRDTTTGPGTTGAGDPATSGGDPAAGSGDPAAGAPSGRDRSSTRTRAPWTPGAISGKTATRTGTKAGTGTKADPDAEPDPEARKRRKRRLLVAGIALAAAIVVVALCAGGLAVLRAVSGFRDDASDAREDRRLRDSACLELEDRLNRLVPPGATTTPQARAVAVRDENAATRIYVGRLDNRRVSDGWRELLDARTSFAEALDAQVRSRTPAFYVAPAPRDGVSLTDQLAQWSPAACAGPIRRLAAPDL